MSTPQTETESNSSQMDQAMQAIDAATLAASQIAKATGIQSLEELAQAFVQLESRVKMLEPLLPLVEDLKTHVEQAAGIAMEALPRGFVMRVEDFFAKHFPSHSAPAQTEKSE